MLTVEILRQNQALAALTDEQLTVIAGMSKNDEDAVIGQRIGTLHGQYDADILSITGIAKQDGEKSYDYAKRVLGEYKTKAESTNELTNQITTLKAEKANLEKKIADGEGNEVLKQQLKDANSRLSQLQTAYDTTKASLDKQKIDYEGKIMNLRINNAFEVATSNLKFKSSIPESVHKALISSAMSEVLGKYKPDYITDAEGKGSLVFRDANDNIVCNPNNSMKPYTAAELFLESSIKDAIDLGRQQGGTGTRRTTGQQDTTTLDLSGAKNQVQADDIIAKYLLAQGLTRTSVEFAEQSRKLREEHGVNKLPLR